MLAWWVVLGLAVGSALDLLIRVLAAKRADIGPSLCPICETPRIDRRLIPLAGHFLAKLCPECRWRPRIEGLSIQVATALAFAVAAERASQVVVLLVLSVYTAILAVVFVFDLRHRLVLNVVTYPSMLGAVAIGGVLGGQDVVGGITRSLLGGLFGGGLFFALFLAASLLYKGIDALGLGDVKLALLIGLMTGWPFAVAAILLGSIIGAVIGLGLMVHLRSRKAMMPYGTALSLGALLTMLWHPPG